MLLTGDCLTGTKNSSINYELRLLQAYSENFMLGNQQAKKGVTILARVIDLLREKWSRYYALRAGKSMSGMQTIFGTSLSNTMPCD